MSKKTIVATTIISILTLIILIGGFWCWLNSEKETHKTNQGDQIIEKINCIFQDKSESIEKNNLNTKNGWKIYRNKEFGFAIAYPDKFNINENNLWSNEPRLFQVSFFDPDEATKNKGYSFGVDVENKGSLSGLANIFKDHPSIGKTIVNNKQASVFFLENGYCEPGILKCHNPLLAIKINTDDKFYSIIFQGVNDINDHFPKEVLESFRLLD